MVACAHTNGRPADWLLQTRKIARWACRKWSGVDRHDSDWEDVEQIAWAAAARASEVYDPANGARWGRFVTIAARNAVLSYRNGRCSGCRRPGGITRRPAGVGVGGLPENDGSVWHPAGVGVGGLPENDGSVWHPAGRDADPADAAASHDLPAAVVAALRTVGDRDRDALAMHCDGMSCAQIGARLGISTERARQLVERAIVRVRLYVANN